MLSTPTRANCAAVKTAMSESSADDFAGFDPTAQERLSRRLRPVLRHVLERGVAQNPGFVAVMKRHARGLASARGLVFPERARSPVEIRTGVYRSLREMLETLKFLALKVRPTDEFVTRTHRAHESDPSIPDFDDAIGHLDDELDGDLRVLEDEVRDDPSGFAEKVVTKWVRGPSRDVFDLFFAPAKRSGARAMGTGENGGFQGPVDSAELERVRYGWVRGSQHDRHRACVESADRHVPVSTRVLVAFAVSAVMACLGAA